MQELLPRQVKFVEAYARDPNATKAARVAGYAEASARSVGNENLRKPHIKAALVAENEKIANEIARGPVKAEDVMAGLRREAEDNGKGSTQAGRVAAWAHLGKILGMFIERRVVEGNVGIVFDMRFGDGLRLVNGDAVPVPAPVDIENLAVAHRPQTDT